MLLMPKAKVINRPSRALLPSVAYQLSASSVGRGLNRTPVPAGGGFGGSGESWSSAGRRDWDGGFAASLFQYSRNFAATAGSLTTCATFEWPKIPPSEKFVPPVQTIAGCPSSSFTMNLLWAMAEGLAVRSVQAGPRPTWPTAV